MMRKMAGIGMLLATFVLFGGVASYAQQHVHNAQPSGSNASAGSNEEEAIFCPTMKTGQLCSHGTANVLGLTGEKQDQWIALARKYDKAVDAATEQLFKDSEGVLTPKQVELLKAWFAVGLNPQINELLYGKGLGPQKTAAAAAGNK